LDREIATLEWPGRLITNKSSIGILSEATGSFAASEDDITGGSNIDPEDIVVGYCAIDQMRSSAIA
jgi:hypothetical protein